MEAISAIVIIYFLVKYAINKTLRDKEDKRLEREEEMLQATLEKIHIDNMMHEIESIASQEPEVDKAQQEIDKQRAKEIEYLRKQGYTEDIITMIIPTINNGQ